MALADVVHESQKPCALNYTSENFQSLDDQLDSLGVTCTQKLISQVLLYYINL